MIGPGVPEVFDIPIDQVIPSLIRRGRSIENNASESTGRRDSRFVDAFAWQRVRATYLARLHPTSPREDRDASARRNPDARPRFSQPTFFLFDSRKR